MRTRRLFVYSALLVLLTTGPVLAGQYQRTKDGKTLVWNEDHKPSDLVSWSGKRDADGYATGYGTLTWYTPEDNLETGSNVPRKHYKVSSRVSGTMVQGKFEEKPSRATAQAATEPEQPKKKGWFSFLRPRPKPTPVLMEATPTPQPRLKSSSTQIEASPQKPSPAPTNAEAGPTAIPRSTPTPSATGHSLDSLMHAPSSLKLDSPTPSPSPAVPSPASTPDVSLQLEQPPSPSQTP